MQRRQSPPLSRPPAPSAHHRYELAPGWVADARRALWLEQERTLVVADVHLGHLWVSRQRGALLPIVPDDTTDRLLELQQEYSPRTWIFLGDTVHASARLSVLENALRSVIRTLSEPGDTQLHFVLGNHDRHLGEMLHRLGLPAPCLREHTLAGHLFVHGDVHTWTVIANRVTPDSRVIHGHQHPAVVLSDGVTTSVKVPCFLVSPRRLVLPAFSPWAAHVPWDAQPALSPLAEGDPPETAVAVLDDRLLPVRLRGGP